MTEIAPPPAALQHPGPEHGPAHVVRLGSAKGGWFRQLGWRHLVGILALVFSLFPILFVLSAALNPVGTLSSAKLIPTNASLDNFVELFTEHPYPRWFFNTMLIGLVSAGASMFISAAAAYAFSRFRFRGRRPALLAILLVQMFPALLAIVVLYLMFTTVTEYYPVIGFNTPWSLILIYLGGALGVNTWLMKGFFDTIPKDLDESAKVDGATHAQIFFGIILPLVRPILAVTALLGFIGTVSEIMLANIFLTEPNSKTVAIGLYGLVAAGRARETNFGVFAAGAIITAIPTVVLFQILQRYIVGGITAGAVKG
jgi:arabinogalactan oligomer/maltooligosaccharide transport system permease protein